MLHVTTIAASQGLVFHEQQLGMDFHFMFEVDLYTAGSFFIAHMAVQYYV